VPEAEVIAERCQAPADRPRVSVIIPTRNRARVLLRSIASVLAQTMGSLEVIVVDDGSDDDTERVVRAIGDARVRYVKCERHRGAAAARNTGIRLGRGQYLAFQDSDDEWLPAKLERQLNLLEQRAPFADVATCGTIDASGDRARTTIAARETLSYHGLLAFSEPLWSGPTILVRQTRATSRVFFDEDLPAGQDWDYVLRLARIARVVSVREPLVRIGRPGGDRISRWSRMLEGRKLLRRKHDSELRRDHRALAAHETGIGRLCVSCGFYTEARRRFWAALCLNPFQASVVVSLSKCYVSQSAVLRQLFRRRPRAIQPC
jgi:glycosyltransferase involved in cell wall biosynthesis